MWTKPWTMKEGFAIGGGLIVAGLLLESYVGPVVWAAFAWPVNIVVLALFLLVVAAMHLFRYHVNAFRLLSTSQAAVPALCYAVALTIVMGLTPQSVDGRWLNNMLTFWPFVLIYVYVVVVLGLTCLQQVSEKLNHNFLITYPSFSLLFHLGLFVAIVCATLGSADIQRLKMITAIGQTEWQALDQNGSVRKMPLAVELRRFIMETYDDGSPRRFASEIQVHTQSGRNIRATVDVNKPLRVEGWTIYQYGYDTRMGASSNTSILEIISDPWLPAVYVGIYMMLLAALLTILSQLWQIVARREKWLLVLLAVVTAAILIFRPSYRIDHLMPALQSPRFAPHVLIYMAAYSLLGVAFLLSVCRLATTGLLKKRWEVPLVFIGLSLMTIGMLFGALWAKEAWGHYWSWDPKETWAAITWFSYLIYIHYQRLPHHSPRLAASMLVVNFLLLQMCWWGIKYLPSVAGSSLHTY